MDSELAHQISPVGTPNLNQSIEFASCKLEPMVNGTHWLSLIIITCSWRSGRTDLGVCEFFLWRSRISMQVRANGTSGAIKSGTGGSQKVWQSRGFRSRFTIVKSLYLWSRYVPLVGQMWAINTYTPADLQVNWMLCSVNIILTHKMYQLPPRPQLCVGTFVYKAIAGQQALTCIEIILLIRGEDIKSSQAQYLFCSTWFPSLCSLQSESSNQIFSLRGFPREFFHWDMEYYPDYKSCDKRKDLFRRDYIVRSSRYVWVILHKSIFKFETHSW